MLTGALALGLASPLAHAQSAARVRGTVSGFDGHVLSVKARDGTDVKIHVTDKTGVNSLYAIKMEDIKQGSFVGVTAVKKGSGDTLYAREVHLFPEAARGTGEGHRDWDLEPGSTMTNATIGAMSAVQGNDGKELTLTFPGGQKKIVVPPGVPIVTYTPGDQSLLKAGAQVFVIAEKGTDGSLTAQRIQVGKDGLKPPM
jgi:hypothetical protein